MAIIGYLVGATIAIVLLSWLWEWALFKRVLDDPANGKVASTATAWLTAGTLAGFGMADGGPFHTVAYLIYLIPAIGVGIWGYRRGVALRQENAPKDNLADIFE